jgi:PleD family two-component response regulator
MEPEIKTSTILVIDDSITNLLLLESILKANGYKVLTAANVRQALYVMFGESPDLILLDLLMPRINGYQLLEAFNIHESTRKIPVIVISAITDKEYLKKGYELGVQEYICKPLDLDHLLASIRKAIPE